MKLWIIKTAEVKDLNHFTPVGEVKAGGISYELITGSNGHRGESGSGKAWSLFYYGFAASPEKWWVVPSSLTEDVLAKMQRR